MKSKKSLMMMLTLVMAVMITACGGNNGNTQGATDSGNSAGDTLSGSILAVGSTALQPLVEQSAQKFMAEKQYSKVQIQVQGGGSGTGLTQVSEGQADIGNSDVFAESKLDQAKAEGLVDHQVAVVAIATVTHPEVGVDSLTKQQLVDIFTGKIKNWSEVGGADQAIQIVNRPASSGTRKTFEDYALGTATEDMQNAIQEESSGTVRKIIGETPGAIGYLALSYLDGKVQPIKYEGVEATVENVANGSYPIWAYQHMYTKGEPNEATKAFLDYMLSDEIQNNDVVELGYIPVNQMQVKRDASGAIF